MKQYDEAFIGIDTAKNKHAVAIADAGREGEIRYLGEIDSAPLPPGPGSRSRLHRGRALIGAKATGRAGQDQSA